MVKCAIQHESLVVMCDPKIVYVAYTLINALEFAEVVKIFEQM